MRSNSKSRPRAADKSDRLSALKAVQKRWMDERTLDIETPTRTLIAATNIPHAAPVAEIAHGDILASNWFSLKNVSPKKSGDEMGNGRSVGNCPLCKNTMISPHLIVP